MLALVIINPPPRLVCGLRACGMCITPKGISHLDIMFMPCRSMERLVAGKLLRVYSIWIESHFSFFLNTSRIVPRRDSSEGCCPRHESNRHRASFGKSILATSLAIDCFATTIRTNKYTWINCPEWYHPGSCHLWFPHPMKRRKSQNHQ
jgi:hypothetical protein